MSWTTRRRPHGQPRGPVRLLRDSPLGLSPCTKGESSSASPTPWTRVGRRGSEAPLVATLDTPEAVVNAVGVRGLLNYDDIVLLVDAIGFSVKRLYPPSSQLNAIVNRRGIPNLSSRIHCSVAKSKAGVGVSRVHLSASMHGKWEATHR